MRLDPIRETSQTRTTITICAADPVVQNLDRQRRRRCEVTSMRHRGRLRMLARYWPDFRTRRSRQPLRSARAGASASLTVSRTGDGSTSNHRLQCDLEPVPAQHSWMKPVRHSTQLLERDRDLTPCLIDAHARRRIVRPAAFPEGSSSSDNAIESLLRAIMKVALQPLPLLLTCFDYSCPRALQLLQVRPLLGL